MNDKATATPRPEFQHVADRINELTDRSGKCWLWTGGLSADGYASVSVKGKTAWAHRAAYEAYVGPIPEGLEIDHLCRVRHCVNPAHLEAVTHKVNMQRREYVASRKTHCKNGHPFDESNTRLSNGKQICRICRREVSRRHREKLAENAEKSQQVAPAMALVQLLTGHPDLPPISWTISETGTLCGTLVMDVDGRPVVAAYAEVIGGEVRTTDFNRNGDHRMSDNVRAVWRDVTVDVWVSYPAVESAAAVAA